MVASGRRVTRCSPQEEVVQIFRNDVDHVDWMAIVGIDGLDPDSGTAWEIGYVREGAPIILLRTDFREWGGRPATRRGQPDAHRDRAHRAMIPTVDEADAPMRRSRGWRLEPAERRPLRPAAAPPAAEAIGTVEGARMVGHPVPSAILDGDTSSSDRWPVQHPASPIMRVPTSLVSSRLMGPCGTRPP